MTIPTPRPLHPSLGAEICGLDLRETLSVEDREALAAALAEYIVLVCQLGPTWNEFWFEDDPGD